MIPATPVEDLKMAEIESVRGPRGSAAAAGGGDGGGGGEGGGGSGDGEVESCSEGWRKLVRGDRVNSGWSRG